MIILNFLYYIVYRVFKLIPRREATEHLLASSFLAGLIMTNIVSILLVLNFFKFLRETFHIEKFQITIIILFLICYVFNRWYFIKSGNYESIVGKFDRKYHTAHFITFLGIVYILGSFIGFWILGFYIQN